MSFSEPPTENSSDDSNFQRILIGAGTLIVVVLTVVVAIFLTLQDLPDEDPTPVAVATATFTPVLVLTHTDTPLPPVPATTAAAESPTEAIEATPTDLPTLPPPTATSPPPPTFTPEPDPPTPTAMPLPTTPVPATPVALDDNGCPRPADWVEYIAQVGDTYNTLASRTNTSVVELQRANCPDSATLRVGQVIYLPFAPPAPKETSTPRPNPNPTNTPEAVIPEISLVSPACVLDAGSDVILTVIGKNFNVRQQGFLVELRGPANLTLELREVSVSDTSFDAIVPGGSPAGNYDVVVTNPSDRSGVKANAFAIATSVCPTPTPLPTNTPVPTATP